MGSFVRQRLIAHLSRGEPCFRSCSRVFGVAAPGYGDGSSAAGYATESGQDEASSSRFQRLIASESVVSEPKATAPGDFALGKLY